MRMIKLEVEFLQNDDSDATPNELAHWLSRVLRGEIAVDDLTKVQTPRVEAIRRKRITGYERVKAGRMITNDQYDEFHKARWIVEHITGTDAKRRLLDAVLDRYYHHQDEDVKKLLELGGDELDLELTLALMNFNWPGSI